jgi:hypothetical protein
MRVVDTRELAVGAVERFNARPIKRERKCSFTWPEVMQEVGVGGAEMYRSNKWQKSAKKFEQYKHVPGHEGGNRIVMITPGFLRDRRNPRRPIDVVGPMVELEGPMPRHFAELGYLIGVQVTLYKKENGALVVPKENAFEIEVQRGKLGAAQHPKTGETFLFVYTDDGGVHMMLTGDSLSIEKDGITG